MVADPVAHADHSARHQGRGDEAVGELDLVDLVAERFEPVGEVEGRRAMLLAEAVVDAERHAEADRDPQLGRRPGGDAGVGLRRGRGWWRSPGARRTASSSSAASAALRASGPKQVSPWKASRSGQVEIRPRCGFSPTSPHQAAGMRTEPAPSEPIAPATSPAATAAAAPPLEPPGVWSSCQGLRVAPKVGVSVKCHWPTSGAWVLPTMIAPAPCSRRTSSASARHASSSPPQPNGVE